MTRAPVGHDRTMGKAKIVQHLRLCAIRLENTDRAILGG